MGARVHIVVALTQLAESSHAHALTMHCSFPTQDGLLRLLEKNNGWMVCGSLQAALDAMDPEKRLQMEGHRPGTYVRLHFTGDSLSSADLHLPGTAVHT